MVKCYVGTISPRGLESLFLETEHAVPFLVRRAYRRRPTEAVCYWAVLPDAAAREVQCQLQWHDHQEALATLCGQAAYSGPSPPRHRRTLAESQLPLFFCTDVTFNGQRATARLPLAEAPQFFLPGRLLE